MLRITLAAVLCLIVPVSARGAAADSAAALEASVAQLRHVAGEWDVVTEFMNPDGTVARSAPGTYRFEWVVQDRVLSGRSEIPALGPASGILFYVNEKQREIEMVSVSQDGRLWIMTGPLGGETRTTRPFPSAGGGEGQLRFTRYNVQQDSFESKMEWTSDGGATWVQGNHQTFTRRK